MEKIRRVDRSITRKGMAVSLTVGILSSLIFGLAMSCTLAWTGKWFVLGSVVGLVGIAVLSVAYPLYRHVRQKKREKIATELLRLTDELLKQ